MGIGLSAYLLAVASGPAYVFDGSDVAKYSPYPKNAYVWFLLANPPAFGLDALVRPHTPITDDKLLVLNFAVSVVWWLALALLLRRRHARPPESGMV